MAHLLVTVADPKARPEIPDPAESVYEPTSHPKVGSVGSTEPAYKFL